MMGHLSKSVSAWKRNGIIKQVYQYMALRARARIIEKSDNDSSVFTCCARSSSLEQSSLSNAQLTEYTNHSTSAQVFSHHSPRGPGSLEVLLYFDRPRKAVILSFAFLPLFLNLCK